MKWDKTKGQEEWVSGLFKITKKFRYFLLKFNDKIITQKPSLESAQKEAQKINDNAQVD